MVFTARVRGLRGELKIFSCVFSFSLKNTGGALLVAIATPMDAQVTEG